MHTPFDPYYDPSPRMLLSKPVALCGFFGSGVPEVAFKICAHTGLPLHDFERAIEHKIGCRIAEYTETLRDIEFEVAMRAINQKPHGILMLRPTTLSDKRLKRILQEKALTVYIQRDIFVLYANILNIIEKNDRSRFHSFDENIDITTLKKTAQRHVQDYQMANTTVRAGNQHATTLYTRLLSIIDAIS